MMDVLSEGLSNVYLLTAATVILAVIIARFFAKYIENKNESQSSKTKIESTNRKWDDTDESNSDHERTEGLVSKLKSARLRELEESLTLDQLEEEKRVEREQLSAIFELLKRQEAQLNVKEIDESELTAQLGLYR